MTGMGRFIGRRLLLVLITLWVVTLVVFSLSRAWGDPREMYWNKGTTKEQWDAWGREWGLDKPLPVQLEWLPAAKMQDGWKSFILPTITLGGFGSAGLLRLVRSSMLNVLDEEYIKLARSKGVARRVVIWRHAFKNAMVAPLNYVGFMLGGLATGTVVVETVFGWPGMGRLALTSAVKNDFPTVAGLVLFFTMLYVGANFLVDVAQAWIDPRIRYT